MAKTKKKPRKARKKKVPYRVGEVHGLDPHQREDRWRWGELRPAIVGDFDPREYTVIADLDFSVAEGFVQYHHYAESLGQNTRFAYGLYHKPTRRLVGVVTYGTPGGPHVLPSSFPGLEEWKDPQRKQRWQKDPETGLLTPADPLSASKHAVELQRLVLLDEVPKYAESWFVDKTFDHLRGADQRGVVSYSDPRYGHVGTVYQALSAWYTGKTKPRTVWRTPDGLELNERNVSKIRAACPHCGSGRSTSGWASWVQKLIDRGAPPPRGWWYRPRRKPRLGKGVCLKAWLDRVLPMVASKERHGGKHKYLWGLTKGQRGSLRKRLGQLDPSRYPKLGGNPRNPHIRTKVSGSCGKAPRSLAVHHVEGPEGKSILLLDADAVDAAGPEMFWEGRCPFLAGFSDGRVKIQRKGVSWEGLPVYATSLELQDLADRVGVPLSVVEQMLVQEGRAWGRSMATGKNPPPPDVNPPWAVRNLRRFWPQLLAAVGPARLPEGPGEVEMGCGHYGCVWPTESGQVFKITSDPTEARFAVASMELGGVRGMVQYYGAFALPDVTHYNRPVFVLWRDLAWDVGGLLRLAPAFGTPRDDRERHQWEVTREALEWLNGWNLHAREIRRYLQDRQRRLGDAATVAILAWEQHGNQPHWSRGSAAVERTNVAPAGTFGPRYERYNKQAVYGLQEVNKVAAHLAACDHIAMMMQTSLYHLSEVGAALDACLEAGILLTDVHAQNIGRIRDPDETVETNPDADLRVLERKARTGDLEAARTLQRHLRRAHRPEPGFLHAMIEPEGYMVWGITDPGHALFLTEQWQGLVVPALPGV